MIPRHWKRAAADNGSSDPNADLRPGRSANTVLGAIRGLMATGAAARDDATGGLVATLGASNVYSVSSNEGLIDITTGINGIPAAITAPFLLRLSFDTLLSGTAASVPHLKVDGFDCGPIQNSGGGPLADGDLVTVRPVLVLGDMAVPTDTKVTRVRVLDMVPSDFATLGSSGFPIGGILPFTGNNTPTGFLVANGAPINRADYPKLWAHAQASGALCTDVQWLSAFLYQGFYSQGDGSTNFRLPHLGGIFLRGLDGGRGFDPGRQTGSSQVDAFRQHAHALTGNGSVVQLYGNAGPNINIPGSDTPNIGLHAVDVAAAGGPETRPYNVAYPFLIRAY